MSDDTERILNPGKFTSAEPFKETAIHQAKERVIEAVRKVIKEAESPAADNETHAKTYLEIIHLRDTLRSLDRARGEGKP